MSNMDIVINGDEKKSKKVNVTRDEKQINQYISYLTQL